MKSLLSFFRRPAAVVAEAGPKNTELESTANASCLRTHRPIYVMLMNCGDKVDTYVAHYVDSVWNGGWWAFHVTRFETWSRASLALYLRSPRTAHAEIEQHLH